LVHGLLQTEDYMRTLLRAWRPWHGFWLYDDNEKVLVETLSAALGLRQLQEIELYGNAFDQLAAVAGYGRSARAIITHVIDDLAQDVPEDDRVAR
jgi:hypothetical protein